jgi:CspA family cold shock protein
MEEGRVKKLVSDRGFGFISDKDGRDLFFHRSQSEDFDSIQEGDAVRYDVAPDGKKGPRAVNVVVLREAVR